MYTWVCGDFPLCDRNGGRKLLQLRNIKKTYDVGDNHVKALDGVSVDFRENEFVSILGPSGCGKTTMLRIIAGFETPGGGEVYFEGKMINDVPPHKRKVNTVFQKYALFPHMTVAENIAFGLKIKGKSKAYINDKIKNR